MALVGIYSYPKSGNTWVRSIIAGFTPDKSIKAVPDLGTSPLSDAYPINGFKFYKSHSGTVIRPGGAETTHVIHVRRNPLDVFTSYMNYESKNVTGNAPVPFDSIESIVGTDLFDSYFKAFLICGNLGVDSKFSAETRSYYENNSYWVDASKKDASIVSIRYEDLLRDPDSTLAFLGDWLSVDAAAISRAIAHAEGETKLNGKFFWKKQVYTYREFLSDEQVELFLKYRGEISTELGYPREFFLEELGRD